LVLGHVISTNLIAVCTAWVAWLRTACDVRGRHLQFLVEVSEYGRPERLLDKSEHRVEVNPGQERGSKRVRQGFLRTKPQVSSEVKHIATL